MPDMLLQAASLAPFPGIRHAFFTRQGGVSEGIYASLNAGLGSQDDAEHVRENRVRMAAAVDVEPHRFLSCYQIHSPTVVVAEEPWSRENAPRADAIVTRIHGLAIGAATADCGPVLFADAAAGVIGAAHAGWKGALGGVLEATIAAMEELGARRTRMVAALGPMISQSNYEVGPEFVASFTAVDAANARFFVSGGAGGRPHFDLPGYIASRLKAAGLTRVEDLALCTYADPERFYSYRRSTHRGEPDYGRHVNAIALVP